MCFFCKRRSAVPVQQLIGDLPAGRLAVRQRVFSHMGIDFFRLLNVNVEWGKVKCYGGHFYLYDDTCEVAHSLNTASCVYAINRFLNKYAFPTQMIYSDNGTNFHDSQK